MAKLSEQAERYDGKPKNLPLLSLFTSLCFLFLFRNGQLYERSRQGIILYYIETTHYSQKNTEKMDCFKK